MKNKVRTCAEKQKSTILLNETNIKTEQKSKQIYGPGTQTKNPKATLVVFHFLKKKKMKGKLHRKKQHNFVYLPSFHFIFLF